MLIVAAFTSLASACAAPGAPHDKGPLADLAWLIGDWRAETGQSVVQERWRVVDARKMAGAGLRQDPETGAFNEFERLEIVVRDGDRFYVADVADNPAPVPFRLVSTAGNAFVFENPEHDFPRRIVYRRLGADSYRVEVSDGAERGFALEFRRQ